MPVLDSTEGAVAQTLTAILGFIAAGVIFVSGIIVILGVFSNPLLPLLVWLLFLGELAAYIAYMIVSIVVGLPLLGLAAGSRAVTRGIR